MSALKSLPLAISRCTAPNASDAATTAKNPLDQRDMGRLGILGTGSCLTAWLVLMILANAISLMMVPMRIESIKQLVPDFPRWVVWPTFALTALNIVFAIPPENQNPAF